MSQAPIGSEEWIACEYKRGRSVAMIATDTGRAKTTIKAVLERCGMKVRPRGAQPGAEVAAVQDPLLERRAFGELLRAVMTAKATMPGGHAYILRRENGAFEGVEVGVHRGRDWQRLGAGETWEEAFAEVGQRARQAWEANEAMRDVRRAVDASSVDG